MSHPRLIPLLLLSLLTACTTTQVQPRSVRGTPQRQVSFSWSPSGTPESELSGYSFWTGSDSNALAVIQTLGVTTNTTVQRLSNGTWFFAVTARGLDGTESDFSNVIAVTVPIKPGTLRIQ